MVHSYNYENYASINRFIVNILYKDIYKIIAVSKKIKRKIKDKYDPIIVYPSAGSIVSDNDSWMPKNLLNEFKY